ncbi:MAG: ribonuclease HI [Gammaproteobacteria bacterium]|jgi:ribonuclease HI|nr:ribonuclease HI [Gammaproteobacteria bacterium]MBT5406119.1 ribonuclease HI [Gammaproteobacteria bacterium]MBT5644266.1 ribonuclease HI [Gammaproteobacteria bacterium]MBT5863900.1 ribonuclease HI [Gammaproteobacteria bacterium]MBT6733792.1 ribonuclease HI [Gammaproteobacteria bacterium]|tara:strand:- start:2037 stop:2489 length:453 start_codon:yes stop_codon:yes gene_type:complete
MTDIIIYTDGACSGNPGVGGWGVVVIKKTDIEKFNGYEKDTTNNRMELMAAIEGIAKQKIGEKITLYTDSKYVKDGITTWVINWRKNNWLTSAKKPVKNKDLWQRLDLLCGKYEVKWKWVRAHQEDLSDETMYNNMADKLARDGIEKWRD